MTLIKAFENSEEFRKYCLRYGTINYVVDGTDSIDSKPTCIYSVTIENRTAIIKMKNGIVVDHLLGELTQKAVELRSQVLSGVRLTTRDMCILLSWQGGTIHQVATETGLSVSQLLDAQP